MITTTFGQTPATSRGSDRLVSHHSDAFELGDRDLSPLEFWSFVKDADCGSSGIPVVLTEAAHARILRAAGFVVELRDQVRPVYGVNTGVGHFTGVVVPPESIQRLQENLLRSHACGVGSLLPRDLVLAMWLIRLNTICQGHSGTRPETVDRVLRLLRAGVLADVPSRGSVGASGDLCPSAHAALPIIGEGMVTRRINGELIRQSAVSSQQCCRNWNSLRSGCRPRKD